MHRSPLQHAPSQVAASKPARAVELVLAVESVLVEQVLVALDDDEVEFGGCVAVGGDAVGRPGRVVQVAPLERRPLVRVVGVGGDEAEALRVDAGWVAEGVDVGDEEKVERLDLVGPGSVGVPVAEGPPEVTELTLTRLSAGRCAQAGGSVSGSCMAAATHCQASRIHCSCPAALRRSSRGLIGSR